MGKKSGHLRVSGLLVCGKKVWTTIFLRDMGKKSGHLRVSGLLVCVSANCRANCPAKAEIYLFTNPFNANSDIWAQKTLPLPGRKCFGGRHYETDRRRQDEYP